MTDEIQAPTSGWDAIEAAMTSLHGNQTPVHLATMVKASMGGPDPLDGISIYEVDAPVPHWHYVSYGFSELYDKVSDNPGISGWGFEMTMRLRRDPAATGDAPVWPANLMQNLARYVFTSGMVFGEGHHLSANGPIATEEETALHAIAFANDAQLEALDTPNGAVEFLQIVGITTDELELAQSWDTARFLQLLERKHPLLVTDLGRASALADPDFAASAAAGAAREGSSQSGTAIGHLTWERTDAGLVIEIGALAIRAVGRAFAGRLPHGRGFVIESPTHFISFQPGETAFEIRNDGDLELCVVSLSDAAVAAIAAIEPVRGETTHPELGDITIRVVPSVIRDQEGNETETIG